MPSIAYYDGNALFGSAVRCRHVPAANATQVAAFFGINGVQAIDGGPRGRQFQISGVWTAADPASFRSFEAVLMSYADGKARPFVDTFGVAWDWVVFRGDYEPGEVAFLDGGFALPFKCVFHGLL